MALLTLGILLVELKVNINEVGCCSCLAWSRRIDLGVAVSSKRTAEWFLGRFSKYKSSRGSGILERRSDHGNCRKVRREDALLAGLNEVGHMSRSWCRPKFDN